MNIIFAVDNNGFDMMAVAMYSVIKNNQMHELDIYLFHRSISKNNIARLKIFEKKFPNISIKISIVDKNRFKDVEVNNKNVTTEAYYRYLAPEILTREKKALYLDYDMLCLTDLGELYNTKLGENYIGAVPDYIVEHSTSFAGFKSGIEFKDEEIYANSGLLLLDIEKLRSSKIMDLFWRNLQEKDMIIRKEFNIFADQTVANITFKGKIKFLNPRYNAFTTVLRETRQKDPAIIHFTGSYKPFTYRNKYTKIYDEAYYEYYRECLEIIGGDDYGLLLKSAAKRLSREIENITDSQKDKDRRLEEARAHIRDLEKRLKLQDMHIHTQENQLNSIASSQKRVLKLIVNKAKRGKVGSQ